MLDFTQKQRIKLLIMITIAFRSRSCCLLVETGKSIMVDNQIKIFHIKVHYGYSVISVLFDIQFKQYIVFSVLDVLYMYTY